MHPRRRLPSQDLVGLHGTAQPVPHVLLHRGGEAERRQGCEVVWGGGLVEHLRLLALRPRVASPRIKGLLVEQVTESVNIPKDSPSHIQNSRGRAALERWASPHRASGAAQAAWKAARLLFPKAKDDDGGRHGYWGSGGDRREEEARSGERRWLRVWGQHPRVAHRHRRLPLLVQVPVARNSTSRPTAEDGG